MPSPRDWVYYLQVTIDNILQYVREQYGIEEDFPFKDGTSSVLRVRGTKKWFCLLSKVSGKCLGLSDNSPKEIINLKNYPFEILSLQDIPYIIPSWHMNKKHWLTIILEDVTDIGIVYSLLDESYRIVSSSVGKKRETCLN